MNSKKLLERASNNPAGVRFRELCLLVESCGFVLKRVSGSHHIYEHTNVPEIVSIQNCKGMAKAYQVRQMLSLIERYALEVKSENA